jgi:hAT family C-terminal dimerisation region
MEQIMSNLNNQTWKAYHPSLVAAMKLACKKMDCYYSLTDSLNAYCIAMVLHPGMKLEYFHNQKWEEEWIEQMETLVREEYTTKYEKVTDESNTAAPKNNSNVDTRFASFGNLSVTTCPHASEIQEYLSHPVENMQDPLKWWTANKNVYPNLHRMALDYLIRKLLYVVGKSVQLTIATNYQANHED